MQTQEPAGDSAPAADQAAQPAPAHTEAPAPAPMLNGPAPVLWTGFGGAIIIFIVVFILVLRSRAGGRERPRSRGPKTAPKLTADKPASAEKPRLDKSPAKTLAGRRAARARNSSSLPARAPKSPSMTNR